MRRRSNNKSSQPRGKSNAPGIYYILFKDFLFRFSLIWLVICSFIIGPTLYDFIERGIESYIAILLLSLLPLFGILMLYSSIKRALRVANLFQTGQRTTATILNYTITGETNNSPSIATIFYDFKYKGESQKGETLSVPYSKARLLAKGDQINILYDRQNHQRTVWADLYN